MMKERQNSYYIYASIAVIIVIIILLISLIFTSSMNDDYINEDRPPVGEDNPPEDDDNDDVEDVIKEEVKFDMPIDGEYSIYRNFWHNDLTDEDKNNAHINGKTCVGTTIISVDNNDFDVISPIDGIISEIEEGIRGTYITISNGNIKVVIHSIKAIDVSLNDEIEAGKKIAISTSNSYDSNANSNIYIELQLESDGKFIRVNPVDYIGKLVSEIKI